jgi:hypothetical protein
MIKQLYAVTLSAMLSGGSAIAGEMTGTMDSGAKGPTTADCETMTSPKREQCMREAKGSGMANPNPGNPAEKGARTPSQPNESQPGMGSVKK